MESVKIQTTTTVKDMFRFQMYQMYWGLMGFVLGLLLAMAAVDLVGNFSTMPVSSRVVCILLLLLILVVNPFVLYSRSKKQVAAMELDTVPMELTLDGAGLFLTQGGASGSVSWSEVTKLAVLKKMMIFYMGRRQIHLVPLERVEPQTADAAVEAVKTFAPGVKVADKRKKRRKR